MPGSSDNSFIPKRGASKKKKSTGKRQIYVFTYISYILTFATLLSAGGVYLYAQYVNNQLSEEIEALNTEIGSFSQADMERVTEFDLRLTQAKDRLDNSVSVNSVFEALQAATVDTVQIESLQMEREADDKFVLDATIQTDSFDSTIFQRGIFLRNDTIEAVEIAQVQNVEAENQDSEQTTEQVTSDKPTVSFQALLDIPLSGVPANPQSYQSTTEPATNPAENPEPQTSEQPDAPVADDGVETDSAQTQTENTVESNNEDTI